MDAPDHEAEIKALEKEGELPMEELLKSLPKEVLEKPSSLESEEEDDEEEEVEKESDLNSPKVLFKSYCKFDVVWIDF